jgi:rare lipoprotein A
LTSLDGMANVIAGEGLYRVQAGPYATRTQAQQAADRIERILDLKPVLITR